MKGKIMASILYPADQLRPNKVDEHFKSELESVKDSGLSVALYTEDFMGNNPYRFTNSPQDSTFVRGWMFSPEEYETFYNAAKKRGVSLATSPSSYVKAHYMNHWYDLFREYTPKTMWFPPNSAIPDIVSSVSNFGERLIVKDLVKSRKAEWETACYIPSHASIESVVAEFIRLQNEDGIGVQGAIVLREFEDFIPEKGELRCWWINGEMVFASPHPNTSQADFTLDMGLVEQCKPLVESLAAPFISMDIAMRNDGVQRIVEIGDGQVSGLSTDIPATPLWEALSSFRV